MTRTNTTAAIVLAAQRWRQYRDQPDLRARVEADLVAAVENLEAERTRRRLAVMR